LTKNKGRQGKMKELRRKLYKRGSSFETTVPMPLLFALDSSKRYDVLFKFDHKENRWFIEFEERKEKAQQKITKKR